MDLDELVTRLDLDTKAALLAGHDRWALPAVPEIGLGSLVMSDGPIGVRGTRATPEDPSVALPSPTALAACWDPELARRVGRLLAQEARRKGVHVLLAPTVNLHRTPLGGRHFECYSEDPLLTGLVGAGYVRGVQDGGVATTVKHFVANDSETQRYTVDVRVDERTLRELYLAPFEIIVRQARPWGVMAAYNSVNGTTMTEHGPLQNGILREEWGFDGFIVSDWTATRHTERAALGGLDVAMPGPITPFGPKLAQAVRDGKVPADVVDAMVRRVLVLAARVGVLDGFEPAVTTLPEPIDGDSLAREVAARSFVLLHNKAGLLPLDATKAAKVAVLGGAARDARILGGGSAVVYPSEVISPLDGLREALPVVYELGADPRTQLPPLGDNAELRWIARDGDGDEVATGPLERGEIRWIGEAPAGVDPQRVRSVEIAGTFTPVESGPQTFGFIGLGEARLEVGGTVLFDGSNQPAGDDPFTAVLNPRERRFDLELPAGEPVEVSFRLTPLGLERGINKYVWIALTLGHSGPEADAERRIERAVAVARDADVAVIVVGTTDQSESEGFDRTTLALPGPQDELVRRVAAANPNTVVVVNAGSPVEMPWADDVAAVLLTWFPGQAAGGALADVLLGREEPGGRLPTTWPKRTEDAPVLNVTPADGVLGYDEGVFIGYRAWLRSDVEPAYWFGHGIGYTEWAYESVEFTPASTEDILGTATVTVRNFGTRRGREIVQAYLAPAEADPERPARWLAGFAAVAAGPGERATAVITVPRRSAQVWRDGGWREAAGPHRLEVGRSVADRRLTVDLKNGTVAG
ncbi:beta-glucosidase [Kutzneria buriramensis]|uniref:Beta-glucosidase n=1 Tax=Kutzneria buriramensis TaxID=1045776 RepID=A0A3E0H065_9PSEU|nr:glycoside hydrolase family 3 C-terminal domain-containing protein [Kutzneria buriramensis]REH36247.1 beta-glucosidase [Kutzneria buriramensis]